VPPLTAPSCGIINGNIRDGQGDEMGSRVAVKYQGREVTGQKVNFEVEKENWNQYSLEDGTKLRMRLVVAQVIRIDGEYTADGDPVYLVNSTNVVATDAPEHLKRGAETGGKVN
jgi:hypothetical protein